LKNRRVAWEQIREHFSGLPPGFWHRPPIIAAIHLAPGNV
jgi:hypothetical protein